MLMVEVTSRGKLALGVSVAIAGLACANLASAQTMGTNSANYNGGYGRVADQENQAASAAVRDANGNLVVVDGIIQAGEGGVLSNAGGAFDTVSGVSTSSGASAIGNNLVVVTQGNWNTVIVNSTQTNNGNVSANTSLNGGVSNDH
jgi:holdfast attachment protein HfaA